VVPGDEDRVDGDQPHALAERAGYLPWFWRGVTIWTSTVRLY
jgi:hypothetical protein